MSSQRITLMRFIQFDYIQHFSLSTIICTHTHAICLGYGKQVTFMLGIKKYIFLHIIFPL
jgi:hypothetical protein